MENEAGKPVSADPPWLNGKPGGIVEYASLQAELEGRDRSHAAANQRECSRRAGSGRMRTLAYMEDGKIRLSVVADKISEGSAGEVKIETQVYSATGDTVFEASRALQANTEKHVFWHGFHRLAPTTPLHLFAGACFPLVNV